MTITWKLYADAGLTTEIDPVAFSHAQAGAGHDRVVFLGSVASDRVLRRGSNPGVDPIQISLYDSAGGSGLAVGAFTLALSAGALATNTPGAALAVGTNLLSGVANAVPVFIRARDVAAAIGTYTDIKLRLAGVIESDA